VTKVLASFTNLESYYSGIMHRNKRRPSLFSIEVHTEGLAPNIYVVNCQMKTSQGPSKQEYLQWPLNDENIYSEKVSVFSEARKIKRTLPQIITRVILNHL